MKQIVRDFLKAHVSMLVRYTLIVAVCIGCFALTGIFSKEKTLFAGIAVTAFLLFILVWAFVDVLAVGPAKFRKRLAELEEADRSEVISGYPNARRLGKRFFYKKDWLMFYSYRRIELIRFGELRSAEPKGSNLFLTLSGGRTVLMPVEPGENDAMLMAVLKQYNKDITFMLNGSPVSVSCDKAEDAGRKDKT